MDSCENRLDSCEIGPVLGGIARNPAVLGAIPVNLGAITVALGLL